MTRELRVRVEAESSDANHRALRRCYICGTYARPFDERNGAIRCEPCSKKARKEPLKDADAEAEAGSEADTTRVDFLV